MHDIIYGIGYLSIFAIFFYALHLYMEKDNRTEFEELRDAYHRLKKPNIDIYDVFGKSSKWYIEYKEVGRHIYVYFKDYNRYSEELKEYLKSNNVQVISHGTVNKNDWKKW